MSDPTCTACASRACVCPSEVQYALDTLDDLLNASEPLSVEDLDRIEVWADNVILDTMRHRRLRKAALSAPHSPAEPVSPVSTPTEATGGAREAQEAGE